MIILSKRQRFILEMMRDGEEIAADGLSVWCGNERTSRSTLNFFIENVLVSQDGVVGTYWHINESGKLLLEGRQDIYRMSDGRYVEDWRTEVIKEHQKARETK